jgi:gliding motility-associated-like protein
MMFLFGSSFVFGQHDFSINQAELNGTKGNSLGDFEKIEVPKRGLFRKFVEDQRKIQLVNLPKNKSIRLIVKGKQSGMLKALNDLKWAEVKTYQGTDVTQYLFSCHSSNVFMRLPSTGGYYLSVFFPHSPTIQPSKKNDHYDPEPNSDGDFLIKDVLIGGDCFDVNNFSLSGRSTSSGTFSSGLSSIGIDEGVILGTGDVSLGVGPNNRTDEGSDDGINSNDPDLQQMVSELFQGSNQPIFDATILEFEFTPTVDSVTFEYVFASEEYCDFVNSEFNDVFGFFISGPGINGAFSNNGENIAVVPGTNDYVSINTLNINTNAPFYVDNVPIGQPQSQAGGGCTTEPITPSPTTDFIEYDGFSVPLQAVANVVPCETYTIKLAIADVNDGLFDSGVMLKAGSFQAGGTALLDVESDLGNNVFIQGCSSGGFTVRRGNTNNFDEPFEVTLSIDPSSTAEPGVDYEPFDTVVVIPAFSMEVLVDLVTLPQFEYDGEEKTIILELDNSCSCETEELVIIIEPVPPLESDLQGDTVCIGSPVFFDPSEEVYPGVEYEWSDGQSGPAITVYPIESGFYYLTLSNVCEELIDTAYIEVVDEPKAILNVDTVICEEDLANIDLEILFEGLGPFSFSYTINGNSYLIDDYLDSVYTIPIDHRDTGNYRINFISGFLDCQGDIEGGGELQFRTLNFQAVVEDASCGGNADGRIEIIPDSASLPYEFVWANGSVNSVRDSLPIGQYDLTLTDGPGCSLDTSFQIEESTDVDYSAELMQRPSCGKANGALRLRLDSSDFQSIRWNTGDSSLILDSLGPGMYTYFIETFTECDIEDSIRVPLAPPLPQIQVDTIWPIQCNRDTGRIFTEVEALRPWSLRWISGDTTQNLSATSAGSYQLVITDSVGCVDSLEAMLPVDTVAPIIQLPDPAILSCVDSSLTLSFDSTLWENVQLSWRNNMDSIISRSNSRIHIFDAGQYSVELLDTINGCLTSELLRVENSEPPAMQLMPYDTLSCNQTSVDVSLSNISPHLRFFLIDGVLGDTLNQGTRSGFTLSNPGSYVILAVDTLSNCKADTAFQIRENLASPSILLPDALTLRCIDSILNIEANIQGNNTYNYEWTNASNEVLSSEFNVPSSTINFETATPGLYTLTVIDSKTGCVSSESIEVIADTDLPLVAVQSQGRITCGQSSVQVFSQGSSSGPRFNYRWLSEDGLLFEEGVDQVSIDSPGSYILQIQNTDNGCINQQDFTIEEDLRPPPLTADLGEPFSCARPIVEWEYIGADSIPVDISWFHNLNLVGDTTVLRLTADQTETMYTLRVRRLDNECVDSLTISPQWDTLSPIAVIDSVPTLPCSNNAVTLSAANSSPQGGLAFEWRTNGDVLGRTPELAVTQAGTYEVWVESDQNGCADSLSATVRTEPIVDFDLAIDPLLCTRPFGQVEITAIDGGTPPFQFSINNSSFSSENSFTQLEAGLHEISLIDALGCTAEKTVVLDSLQDLEIDLLAELTLNYNEEYQIDLSLNRTEDEIASVEWTPEDQLSCSQCLFPLLIGRLDQDIRVFVEDIYGCTDEATLRLLVELDPQIFIPNVFSPNGDGINDTFFPNAGPTIVNVPTMMLFDRWGNLLFEQRNFPPNNPQMGWDGRYKGKVLDPAVFAYLIKVELVTGEIISLTGDVTLVK